MDTRNHGIVCQHVGIVGQLVEPPSDRITFAISSIFHIRNPTCESFTNPVAGIAVRKDYAATHQ